MRKGLGVALHVIAGFFFNIASLLGFVNGVPAGGKLGIMIGFTVPAVLALCCGLALRRFRDWKREAGLVLVWSSGTTGFVVFSLVCTFMTDDFKKMIKPDAARFFSDYSTGSAVILGLAGLGLFLLKTSRGWGTRQQTA